MAKGDYLHREYYSLHHLSVPVLYQTALTLHIGEANGRGFMGPFLAGLERIIRQKFLGYLLVGMTSNPGMKKFYDKFPRSVKTRDIRLANTLIEHIEPDYERTKDDTERQWRIVTASPAMLSPTGGIDLNTGQMRMGIQKQGQGVEMRFDPALAAHLKIEGFDGLEFHIQSIIPISSHQVLN